MIPHNRLTLGQEEVDAAARIIKSGRLAQGVEVESFEDEICEYLGIDIGHAVAVSSGTAALYMAIRAMESRYNISDVAIPAYSCSALRNAVMMDSKKVVPVDTVENSPNIDIEDKHYKDADLKIFCHMYGTVSEISEPERVIEDCAQSIGGMCPEGKSMAGTQGEISVFSFYATKPISSGGEGGMVVSGNKDMIAYIRDIRDFDMKNDSKVRFNMKMTDIQAAVGRVQLKKLPGFIKKRRVLASNYKDAGIEPWSGQKFGGGSFSYRYIIESRNQGKLISYLNSENIGAIIPIEYGELLCEPRLIPNALSLTQKLVSIPIYPSLSEEEQGCIIDALLKYKDREGIL